MFIFDFDGVIANSLSHCQQACQAATAAQGSPIQLAANPFENLAPVTFEALACSMQLNPQRFTESVMQHLNCVTTYPALFDGMAESLCALAQISRIFILSATHTPQLQAICQHHGIDSYISGIIGGDIAGSKGEKIIQQLQPQATPHESIIMIGDSVSDIDAAHTANITAVAVTWGWQSQTKLRSHNPHHIVHTPQQLRELLMQLHQHTPTQPLC